jgi:hypothetical protein
MATWKVKYTEVSVIDNSLRVDVKFNILRPNGNILTVGGQTVTLLATGNPLNIKARSVEVATDYLRELAASLLVTVGSEVPFEAD